RQTSLAVHRRREREHLEIVRRIRRKAFTFGRLLIRLPRLKAGAYGIAPSTHPRPSVRRHVIEVTGTWYRIAQIFGARHCPFRLRRQLGRVDVEMTSPGVPEVTLQRSLEHAQEAGHGWSLDVEHPRTRQ